jgi:hypothetical protein
VVGVNLPWFRYGGDFGGNAWQPQGGLARPEAGARADETFARLADLGLRRVRWWLLGDGRAGLREGPGPDDVALDDRLLADLDAGLERAGRHSLQVMPVFFDFHWFKERQRVNGVALGGRSDLVRRPAALARLLDRVVRPLFERYRDHPAVWAFDLLNEPEWATLGFGARPARESIASPTMIAFLREMATLGHGLTNRPITVGLASAAGLPLVRGLGLEFYQVHWYALDAPILLGEFPTRGSARPPREILSVARTAGYSGALAWSVLAEDPASDWSDAPRGEVVGWMTDQADVWRA